MTAHQLGAVAGLAREFTDGSIEITSRANLQLRAIQTRNLEAISDRIAAAGLLPSPQHDRVRNIATNPLAGLDPEETLDTRPLVLELDRRLSAESIFAGLHPKFSFGIYGSSRRFSHESDDLSLEAFRFRGDLFLRLSIGGLASGFAVTYPRAVDCLLETARICIGLAKEVALPVRAKAVIAVPGALQRITDSLSHCLSPCEPATEATSFVEARPGIYSATQPDRVTIVPSVPLGRLHGKQARYISYAATEIEADLRLAPWRGIVFGSVPSNAASSIVDKLRSIGLSCDGQDGFQGITACAGITGCDAALADVRRDATSLAQRFAGLPPPAAWTVNLSGCDKQCGRRHGATADLIADASGYTLRINGQPAASGCSAEFALDTLTAFHADVLSEVESR
jgi:sulfite reductase beta subunit-like hemoprotein